MTLIKAFFSPTRSLPVSYLCLSGESLLSFITLAPYIQPKRVHCDQNEIWLCRYLLMRSAMHVFMWLLSSKEYFPNMYVFWSFKDLFQWSGHKHLTAGLPQMQQMLLYVFFPPSFCPPQCWWCVTVHSAKCKMIMVMTMWHHHYTWRAVTGAMRESWGVGG